MNERPLAEQTLEDVLCFLGQGVGENLTLDYKREVSPEKPKDNAELCKDVSALANSAGGTILYGVDEEKPERTPALPPHGIARQVGRQPVEEWAAQVLAAGVQPRMDFEIGIYDLEDSGDPAIRASNGGGTGRCVMAVRVQASPYAPHMVVSKADNRYYGRFYRRSNYESRIAEEYEVREMLERARRLYEGVEGEVARRGFGDPRSPDFADNDYARLLVSNPRHSPHKGVEPGARRVVVLLLPIGPSSRAAVARQDRTEWIRWLDPNARRYEPEPGGIFVPGEVQRPAFGGVASLRYHYERGEGSPRAVRSGITEYLLVGFDGSVELGFSGAVFRHEDYPVFWFNGGDILTKAWQAVNFTQDIHRRLNLTPVPYLLLVNVKNSGDGALTGLAGSWVHEDPLHGGWGRDDWLPRCMETNLQVRRELGPEDFDEIGRCTWASPPPQMRDLAEEISSAFGIFEPALLPPAQEPPVREG